MVDQLTPQTSAPSDEELAARCRTELPYDTRAFETLVRRYEGRVLATCHGMLDNVQDAEEVMQDVFLSVYWAIGGFRRDGSFSAWLSRIVRNKCISRRRSRQRQERLSADAVPQLAHHAATTPVTAGDREIGVGPVAEAFQRLSPADRRVLRLRHLDHLPLRQLAQVCGVTLSAAKMRLYRAEQRFRELYQSGTTALPV